MFAKPSVYIYQTLTVLALIFLSGGSVFAQTTPTCRVVAQKYGTQPNESFTVEYRVEWKGNREALLVLPLLLPKIDWGTAEIKETRTEGSGDTWSVIQYVNYQAAKPGLYSIPKEDIPVISQNIPAPGAITEKSTMLLSADALSMKVSRPIDSKWIALGVLVALLCMAGIGYKVHNGKKHGKPGDDNRASTANEFFHEARRKRLDGDLYTALQILLKTVEAFPNPDMDSKTVTELLKRRLPEVGYKGMRPTDDEMDGLFREIERLLSKQTDAAKRP